MVTSAARACGFGNPQGETTVVVSFYHRNWRFEETGTGSPQGFIASRGAFSPFANATQWLDDSLASMLPGGPFWGYGAPTDGHFAFSFKNPNITDTWGEWELNGLAGCLIKCKWAETVDAPQPPGKDFVFKEWKFNFRDFEENYGWNALAWYRNYVEIPAQIQYNLQNDPDMPVCAGMDLAPAIRYTAVQINPPDPGQGYFIDPGRGSYWLSEMNCTTKH